MLPRGPPAAGGTTLLGMSALPVPFQVSIYCWLAFEISLLVRDLVRGKGRAGHDRGTRLIVSVSLGAAIVLAWLIPAWAPGAGTPAPTGFAVAGLVVMWIGLAVRAWAVLTLGGSFSTYLQVEGDQAVVTRGPYRWVRHPSYTGLLLIGLDSASGQATGCPSWSALSYRRWDCCRASRSKSPNWSGCWVSSTAAISAGRIVWFRDSGDRSRAGCEPNVFRDLASRHLPAAPPAHRSRYEQRTDPAGTDTVHCSRVRA